MSRILVVDDEVEIRDILRDLLETEGYEVFEASDGIEAHKIYSEHSIDVIILDLIMPKKNGLQSIIDFTKKFPDVKIIVMSGGGLDQLNMARSFGARYVFSKPFRMKEMLEAVARLLADEDPSFPPDRPLTPGSKDL